jgi:hypothetical protein
VIEPLFELFLWKTSGMEQKSEWRKHDPCGHAQIILQISPIFYICVLKNNEPMYDE